ncbi:MAG: exosortase/archaeosortase family protein [Flavobacteriales bacterium]|nr:exosortase/archaeosortase family protein [Flavobacteriales bacterium]MCB9203712.1 exosortase/archaeosortase family protein [Flavobacteriales bacterium]
MSFYERNKNVIWFLVKLTGLCSFYFLWFAPNVWQLPVISTLYGHFVHYTLKFLIEPSVWLLNVLGYGAVVVHQREIDLFDLEFNAHIKNFCLGIDMMFSLSALIISFPGKWIDRLWFLPLGLIGIQLINISRITGLCLAWLTFGISDKIDHHDLFNIVSVIFIFFMFVLWVNRYKKEPAR